MGKAASAADCLRQAEECLGLAQATSDLKLKEQYLKIAGELTRLAAILDKSPGDGSAHESEQTMEPKLHLSHENRRS